MLKIISILMITGILLSVIPVFAQEELATIEDVDNAGITPDNILYPIDIALERVTEVFSEDAKLKHAKERLSEIKVMIDENKVEEAEEVRQNFNKLRERVQNKTQIKEHTELMDSLGQKISAIASQKGKLTEEQRGEIKTLILAHKERIRIEEDEIDEEIEDEVEEEDNETENNGTI